MTPSQRSVLVTLDRNGPLRMGDLAAIEKVTAPRITGIIGRLEVRALVARETHPDDAHSTMVRPSPSTEEVQIAVRRKHAAFLTTRLASLQDSEVATLAKAIRLFDRIAADG